MVAPKGPQKFCNTVVKLCHTADVDIHRSKKPGFSPVEHLETTIYLLTAN